MRAFRMSEIKKNHCRRPAKRHGPTYGRGPDPEKPGHTFLLDGQGRGSARRQNQDGLM